MRNTEDSLNRKIQHATTTPFQSALLRAGSAAALILANFVFALNANAQGFFNMMQKPANVGAVPCTKNVPPTNPDHVYRLETISGVDVVRDIRNGLMWKRDIELGKYTFDQAASHATSATDANFSDWRVPSIDELTSLVEKCRTRPALNNVIFRDNSDPYVWSGSPRSGNLSYAWHVNFVNGDAFDGFNRNSANSVRLVRGGQLFDILSDGQRTAVASALKSQAFRWLVSEEHRSQATPGQGTTTDLHARLQRALLSGHLAARADVEAMPNSSLAEPREADFQRALTVRERGEFETTAAFEARKRDKQAAHEASVKQAYGSAMQTYQAAQRKYQQSVARQQEAKAAFESRMETPAGWAPLLDEAWKEVVAKHLGGPILTDVSYDADKQVFNATLRSSMGTFSKPVVAPVPIDRAQAMKADLVSGKIAPAVTLRFPGPEATWELVENDALRQRRFSEANNSVAELESLILEYPLSTEAKSARTRIFQVPNTSKELTAVTSRLSAWPEASTGRARLREVQMAEWKAAEAKSSSAAFKSFVNNFAGVDSQGLLARARSAQQIAQANEAAEERRAQAQRQREQEQWERDRPRREAAQASEQAARTNADSSRRICEAQRQTCMAACPSYRSNASGNFRCESQCNQIICN